MSPHNNPLTFRSKLDRVVGEVVEGRHNRVTLSSLAGSAGPLFISQLARKAVKPILVLAETYEIAEYIRQDLSFFMDSDQIGFFPQWDTIPYDNQSPAKDVLAVRFETLSGMLQGSRPVVVTTPNAVMQYIMPPGEFLGHGFTLQAGSSYQREELLRQLVGCGFVRVEMVEEKAEFSVRGEIIDVFPVTEAQPVRLDFFDDTLESIRFFDIESQRSRDNTDAITFVPAQEVLYKSGTSARVTEKLIDFKANTVPQTYNYMVEQIREQAVFSGMENLLPLFYESTASLLDYFVDPPMIVCLNRQAIDRRVENYFEEILNEYNYSRQEGNPTLDPGLLFMTKAQLKVELDRHYTLDLQEMNLERHHEQFNLSTVDNAAVRSLAVDSDSMDQSAVQNILRQLALWNREGAKVIIAANSEAKADRISQMLEEIELSVPILNETDWHQHVDFLLTDFSTTAPSFIISTSPIHNGFRWIDPEGQTRLVLISDEEIFGRRKRQRRLKRSDIKQIFSSLADLNVGDYVVHVEYGIGKYEGLKRITAGQNESDYLVIVYHGGDKVYVPVDKFHLVQKYTGGDVGQPKISKLGTKAWTKTKSKVRSEIDDMAEELVKISAMRLAKKGVAFSPDARLMTEFTFTFPFQETDDQEKAIREVLQDMEKENPMDRLVCGDVGFGKTEVAMRAAYKAIIDGYQVGILVPTTILAQQHFDSFCERFSELPVTVGLLSRFQTPKQIRVTLSGLKKGTVDIVIGTHRLLSKDVVFKQLGLLVIDEEQRFGVKHKETIKKYRTTVDTLTLTATPIPRTLHMSFVGIRDISVINTPPMDRRAIRTRLMKLNDYVIQEAVNREIRRKGQVFFIHNRVESIYQVGEYLSSILPDVRIAVAHGQMAERELEKVMFDFVQKEHDLLLATTIVESGLDIPNVNTIIVNNADQFGLAQLYQLRGRVGRSNLQAYAYLMTPREKILTETARKRLAILQELNHLGAGFKIANYDLELRGAGNVLGPQQSGHIAAVGFEMYTAMIEEAVAKIKQGEVKKIQPERDIKLNLLHEASIPDSYVESMNQRLEAYKIISSCKTEEELWDIRGSLEDRFGRMPEETVCLFHKMQIKFLATELFVSQISQSYDSLEISFTDEFKPDPQKLLAYLAEPGNKARLLPDNRLEIGFQDGDSQALIRLLQSFRKSVL